MWNLKPEKRCWFSWYCCVYARTVMHSFYISHNVKRKLCEGMQRPQQINKIEKRKFCRKSNLKLIRGACILIYVIHVRYLRHVIGHNPNVNKFNLKWIKTQTSTELRNETNFRLFVFYPAHMASNFSFDCTFIHHDPVYVLALHCIRWNKISNVFFSCRPPQDTTLVFYSAFQNF